MHTHHRTERFTGSQNIKNDEVVQVLNFNNSQQSRLFINSNDKTGGNYARSSYDNKGKLVRQDISQIGFKKIVLNYNIPNINTTNNVFRFAIGEGTHTVTVPIGYYPTLQAFMTELASQMSAQGAFTFTYTPNGTGSGVLTCDEDWRWLACIGINNNRPHGLFYFDGSHGSQTAIGDMLYTEYIDILISRVKNAQITINTYSQNRPFDNKEHVARIYLPSNVGKIDEFNKIIDNFTIVDYFPYRKRQLTQLKIDLYDEYGELLYTKPESINSSNYEIKYLTYNIELSLVT